MKQAKCEKSQISKKEKKQEWKIQWEILDPEREKRRKKEAGRQSYSKRQTRCLVSESSNPVEVWRVLNYPG